MTYLLVVNTKFESSRTPINELNGPPHFNAGDSLISIPRDNITTVQECTSHIMGGTRITDDHLVVGLETLERDVLDAMRLMLCFCL